MDQHMPKQAAQSDWDLAGLSEAIERDFATKTDARGWLEREPELEEPALRGRLLEAVYAAYDAKVARVGAETMRHVEKQVMLQRLDMHWREHLAGMDYLRQGIHLRGYAQKDYRFEFKREAFELFSAMLDRIKFETASLMATVEIRTQQDIEREEEERRRRLMRALQAQHDEAGSLLADPDAPAQPAPPQAAPRPAARGLPERRPGSAPALPPATDSAGTFVRAERKVGRNEPCPCGSGKKYKHCHGVLSSGDAA